VSGRTVIRAGDLRGIEVTLHNPAPLNRVETLQLLDTTLAQHGIHMVVAGDNAVIATQDLRNASPPIINSPASQLPDSSSYMMTMVRLIQSDPSRTMQTLIMKAKVQNSLIYTPAGHLLILRDYASSILQMLAAIPEAEP
ncbi:MAG: hypothetical protein ABSF38_15910, partial [Verrucomicrobiota bacterium]